MGGEKGVQVTWLPDLPVYLQLGIEALQGENDHLFGADAKDGPHAFTVFAKTSMEIGESGTILFGPSYAWGKANIPTVADNTTFTGDTDLFGFEMVYKWKPSKGYGAYPPERIPLPEANRRSPHGRPGGSGLDARIPETGTGRNLRPGTLPDRPVAHRRAIRRRWTSSRRISSSPGTQQDLGKQPWRATGALEFNPSEFTRVRLQYARDESSRDGKANNEVYLQMLLGIGAHAAHSF